MVENEKIFQDKYKNLNNPFAQKCKDCNPDILKTLEIKAREQNFKCFSNTYIKIEKFKDDKY